LRFLFESSTHIKQIIFLLNNKQKRKVYKDPILIEIQISTKRGDESILYQFSPVYFLSMIKVIYKCLLNHQCMHKLKKHKKHITLGFLHGNPM
jgi:hypothetical protein